MQAPGSLAVVSQFKPPWTTPSILRKQGRFSLAFGQGGRRSRGPLKTNLNGPRTAVPGCLFGAFFTPNSKQFTD
jgi:hypothetical protein